LSEWLQYFQQQTGKNYNKYMTTDKLSYLLADLQVLAIIMLHVHDATII